MKIVTEKREIVGTLKTLVGTYNLLDRNIYPIKRGENDILSCTVVDDEGFKNTVQFRGDFITIPLAIPTMMDVKRVVEDEEVVDEIVTFETID